ncbi:MAG: hypothetical protein IJO68_01055 [Clostridia bacterium]|nr:hypothetical protein [Clostridia bacterium]
MVFKEVLRILSEKYGVESEKVLTEMNEAINMCNSVSAPLWVNIFGKDAKLTAEEFIKKISEAVAVQLHC